MIDRRKAVLGLTVSALTPTLAPTLAGCATSDPNAPAPPPQSNDGWSRDEVLNAANTFFGAGAEGLGAAVERLFRDNGRPNAYISGQEISGAFAVGLRYGDGNIFMKNGEAARVFWQGPSVGFDAGGNASKVFTLVYNLGRVTDIYQRYPGLDGSAYFIGGVGVNYLQLGNVRLAPMRTGVGFRAGASVGYLAFSRERNILPF
jgi:hypothetical protein